MVDSQELMQIIIYHNPSASQRLMVDSQELMQIIIYHNRSAVLFKD